MDDKSGLLESGDYDENGEYDENSESSQQWQKIAEGLTTILTRLQEALLAKKKVDGMENLTKMVNLAKIYHGFNKYSSWMP